MRAAGGLLDTNPIGETVPVRTMFPEQKIFSSNVFTHPKIWSFMYAYALPPEGKSSRRSILKLKKSCKRVNIFVYIYLFWGEGKAVTTFLVTSMWKLQTIPPKSLGQSQTIRPPI